MAVTPLSSLERPEGGFAMVALDQRESMRDLLGDRRTDADMRSFKRAAASTLAPGASAILLDRFYGLDGEAPPWVDATPLIVAADAFTQQPGAPLTASVLDDSVTPDYLAAVGASAVKFLALWREDDDPDEREHLVESFLELARRAEVLAVLEGIVRPGPDGWRDRDHRDGAIVAAGTEFGAMGPDLYKAEVPGDPSDPDSIEAASARVTSAIDVPWVVLSNGVPADAFPGAVGAARRGGAAGFLAGRAVWTAAASAPDWAAALAEDSLPRLARLRERLDVAKRV